MPDAYQRRTGDDYAGAWSDLLPTGIAWPRNSDSVLMRFIKGLAQVWGFVDSRASNLLEIETDPRKTYELLPEWERAWGLPDYCMPLPQTIEERRLRLIIRMTLLGAQSREFFMFVANWLGYTIGIEEFLPIIGGISRGGEYEWQAGPPELRYWWVVHVYNEPIWWFRGGVGEGGKDHHAEWAVLIDLECLIIRYKPAHTEVIFDYAG